MVNFTKAKELFRDVVDLNYYIPLATSEKTKNDLLNAISQKDKIILLTGKPGSGKSLILKSVYKELENKKKVFFVSNPYLEINAVISLLKNLDLSSHHVLFLDEAQLLTAEIWENLRIYADRGNVTIVFATHDTNIKVLLSKKHFQTRINYIIPVKNVTLDEMEKFIYSKLLKNNFNEISDMFSKHNFKKIYTYTKGSLRATNQFVYKLFDIMDFFYQRNPLNFNNNKIEDKYIEIAMMDLKVK